MAKSCVHEITILLYIISAVASIINGALNFGMCKFEFTIALSNTSSHIFTLFKKIIVIISVKKVCSTVNLVFIDIIF